MAGTTIRREDVVTLGLAAAIGVAGAAAAILFRYLIKLSHRLFFGRWEYSLDAIGAMPWWLKLLLPASGGLLVGLLAAYLARELRGSGIPGVIEAVALRGGRVRKRVAPLKALSAAITIGSGGSAGREGPIVHIGAAVASVLAQLVKASVTQHRTLVGCGVAAGIAATFNTPFAGALFAVEAILADFGIARISPIVVSTVVATVVSRQFMGDFPVIASPGFQIFSPVELLFYALLGLAAALLSALFIRAMQLGWRIEQRSKLPGWLRPAVGGLMVGLLGIAVPHVFGVGYEALNLALVGQLGVGLALVVLFAKLLATVLTLASGGSGGVFAPSLVMGAMAGVATGLAMDQLLPGVGAPPHAYALVGMGAMVAGTTRAPISAVLMIFELTNVYQVILPLMVACIPSTVLSAVLVRDSVYRAQLSFRGIDVSRSSSPNILKRLLVADVMQEQVPRLSPAAPLREVIDTFLASPHPDAFVVDDEGRIRGVLESRTLRWLVLEADALEGLMVADDLARPCPASVRPGDDLALALHLFATSRLEVLPVVGADGVLLGELTEAAVLTAYDRELAISDLSSTTIDAVSMTERIGEVDLGHGFALAELEVPHHVVGRTLAEIDLRKRFGVQVLLIRKRPSPERGEYEARRVVPQADDRLDLGDRLLLAGPRERLTEISRM